MRKKIFAFLLFLLFIFPNALSAQGLFKGLSVPATVASNGQTEPIGQILVAMTSGPLVQDTLVIDLSPLKITNASASDIVVKATGLAVSGTSIDTVNSLVQIPVQTSLTSTASLSISGIRVAVAGTGISSFNAQLRWQDSKNAFIAGPSVPVIDTVRAAIISRTITPPALAPGQTNTTRSTIQLAEGFAAAFSDGSQYGQTGPTKIQITVTDFPAGAQLQFPVSVSANETSATLSLSGSPSTLSGNGTITYAFSSVDQSSSLTESFNINMDLTPAINAQPTLHVTLAPIGAAVPNAAFTSTSIPRYAEDEIFVDPASSLAAKKILYWTGVNPSLQNQIQVMNPAMQTSKLTIDAFDSKGNAISGTGVTSHLIMTIPPNQWILSSLSSLFGTATGISSIRIQSTTPDLLAAALINDTAQKQAVPFISLGVTSLIFPVVSDGAQFYVMNTTAAAVSGTLTLLTAAGETLASTSINLAPMASAILPVQTIFAKAPQSGYATAVFSDSVIAYESFGKGNLEPIQPPTLQPTVFVPFIAGGSAFTPSLKLINVVHDTVTVNAGLYSNSGTLLATQPITMTSTQESVGSLQQIFSQSPDSAYVEIDLPLIGKGFFVSYPLIDGQAQIETGPGASTVIPLSVSQSTDTFILGQPINPPGFEGVALLNPTASNVTATVRAVKSDGSVAASATVNLKPRELAAQLTDQLFNGAVPAQTIIRVTSTAPIAVTAITGSIALDQILALPVGW